MNLKKQHLYEESSKGLLGAKILNERIALIFLNTYY